VGCQTTPAVTTPPVNISTTVEPNETCTCPDTSVIAPHEKCPPPEISQEIEHLDHLLDRKSNRGIANQFYRAEVARIQQGLLSQFTCGERQQRNYLLPELLSTNRDNVHLGITYIESLYERYDPNIERATSVRKHERHHPSFSRRYYNDPYYYDHSLFYHPFYHRGMFYNDLYWNRRWFR
jgi:hypothetical protein